MRKNNLKASPTCSYVKAVFEKKLADFEDVIA
jgi:predicted GNAT family acetyltransferase